jgi:hypothetical protein
VGGAGEGATLFESDRRTRVPLLAERRARGAERAGDDEYVAGLRAAAARHALRAAERRHAEDQPVGSGRVAADHRDAGLGEALVQLENVVQLGIARCRERHDEAVRRGSAGGEIAEIDGCGPEAEVAPGDPAEAKVHTLDERVLRDHAAARELGGVVPDPPGKTTPRELGE